MPEVNKRKMPAAGIRVVRALARGMERMGSSSATCVVLSLSVTVVQIGSTFATEASTQTLQSIINGFRNICAPGGRITGVKSNINILLNLDDRRDKTFVIISSN